MVRGQVELAVHPGLQVVAEQVVLQELAVHQELPAQVVRQVVRVLLEVQEQVVHQVHQVVMEPQVQVVLAVHQVVQVLRELVDFQVIYTEQLHQHYYQFRQVVPALLL